MSAKLTPIKFLCLCLTVLSLPLVHVFATEETSSAPNPAARVNASAPTLSFNNPAEAYYTINAGDSITFRVNATDAEANLSGTEWYGNGDKPFIQKLSDAEGDGSRAIFSRTHTFPYGGIYQIKVLAFDSGSAYSSSLVWYITVNGTGEDFSSTRPSRLGQRALFVNDFDIALASRAGTDKLLAHIQSHSITKLTLYDLNTLLPSKSKEISAFIGRAKRLGVESVGAGAGGERGIDLVMAYQNDTTNQNKFDTLYLEYEYWNVDSDSRRFLELLDYMHEVGGGMPVEAYLGFMKPGDAAKIASRLDNLFLHCYVHDAADAFSRCLNRLKEFGELNTGLNVWPLFSAEWRPRNTCDSPPWGANDLCFMGRWLQQNGVEAAEKLFLDAYNEEPGSWKAGIRLAGFHYYAYTFLDEQVGSPNQPAD